MSHIKKLLLLGSIFILVIILLFVFWPKNQLTVVDQSVCKPYVDIASIIKTGEIRGCDCLKNIEQIKSCQDTITGAGSLTTATQKSDLSQCNNITDEGMKAACISITQGKIDFAKKNNTVILPATSTKKK